MHAGNDAIMLVRAELCEHLAGLQAAAIRLSARDFHDATEAIRGLAAAYGLIPVVRLADAMERASAQDGAGCPRALYLARLQDAIGCERIEESAAEALLASVSVRLCA